MLTTDESARRSAQNYGFAAQENRSAFANDLIEESRGPRPQSTEYFGPQNNGYEMHRKQEAPEGPVRNQTPSVCGSPARRNVLSRASIQGLSGRSSAQGYQLPPTPPSAGREEAVTEEIVLGEGMRSLRLAFSRNFNSWRRKMSYCRRRSHNVDGIKVGR